MNERANDVVSPLLSLSLISLVPSLPFSSLALPPSLLFSSLFSVRAQKSLALVEASPSYSATEGFKAYVSLSLSSSKTTSPPRLVRDKAHLFLSLSSPSLFSPEVHTRQIQYSPTGELFAYVLPTS